MILASILSPPSPYLRLGPLMLHGYALAALAGIAAAVWAVPFGLVGGRLYHVLTDSELYFGPGRNPVSALYNAIHL